MWKAFYQKGSTFFLSVKAEDRGEAEIKAIYPSGEDRPKKAALQIEESALNKARILIAEDNAMNSKVALLLVKQLGLQPDVVVNGAEAVQAFMDQHYDIILMDLQMPIMNGEHATRKIRLYTGDADTPWIIALSASAMTQNREAAFQAGVNDFIPKPITAEILRLALTKAFAKVSDSKRKKSIPVSVES